MRNNAWQHSSALIEKLRKFRDNDDDESGMDQNTKTLRLSRLPLSNAMNHVGNWTICVDWVILQGVKTLTSSRFAFELTRRCRKSFKIDFFNFYFLSADACNSRTVPRPRTTPAPQVSTTTPRPNITFQTFTCPPDFATWYCLNGATCFLVKIGDGQLYNCE